MVLILFGFHFWAFCRPLGTNILRLWVFRLWFYASKVQTVSYNKDAEVGQNEVPDSTISKDVSAVCSRRIEASGQEVECRGLRARSKWAELAEI